MKPFIIYSLFAPAALMAQERPNILYIMTDQQTATAMSCAGNEEVHTPNMDRLAQRGVRFSNAYCSMPLSGPSRSSMFTGYTPGQVGLTENGTPMPDSIRTRTLGTLLEESGYECAYAGKWHAHTNSLPAKEAFGFENLHGHKNSLSSWSPLSIIRITFASMRVIRIRPMLRSKSRRLKIVPACLPILRSIRMMPTPWLSSAGRTIGFIRP